MMTRIVRLHHHRPPPSLLTRSDSREDFPDRAMASASFSAAVNGPVALRNARIGRPISRAPFLALPSSRRRGLTGGRRQFGAARLRRIVAQSSSSGGGQGLEASAVAEERTSLQHLAETLYLPQGFLSSLPDDLRLDLNDAAFALSSGPLNQECGEKVGAIVMGLSRAWEQADTQAAAAVAEQVPALQEYLPSDPSSHAALGKRLQAAGNYLASTGQYGNGELQKMAKSLLAAGKAFSLGSPVPSAAAPLKDTARTLKFGDLQVKITSKNAYIGAVIALVFGVLCWQLTSSLQSSPISESQYANDNSSAAASSLRGTLLTAGYSCTALSGLTMAGLLALASQMGREE